MEKDLLLKKWLNNDMTDAEKIAFSQQDDYVLDQEIIDTVQRFKATHFSNINDFKTFKTRYKSKKSSIKRMHWLSPMLKIASVIIIALGIYFSFYFSATTKIETAIGEKTTIELPDASYVTLNALSLVEYNKKNWKDKRSLKLEGEAYFDVAKGKTFDVITTDGIVSVVGTQFNVKQRDDYFEVKCFEGMVEVTTNSNTRQLLPGDAFRLFEGRNTKNKTVITAPKWINNISVFNAISIKEVVAELERQYAVKVTFNNANTKRLFTGGFAHNNLNKALFSITVPMNMTYTLDKQNQVIIYGQKK